MRYFRDAVYLAVGVGLCVAVAKWIYYCLPFGQRHQNLYGLLVLGSLAVIPLGLGLTSWLLWPTVPPSSGPRSKRCT